MCSVEIVSRSELTGNSPLLFSLLLLSISPPHTQASVLCRGERSDPEFRTAEKIPTKRIKKCSLPLGLLAWFTFTFLNCLEVETLVNAGEKTFPGKCLTVNLGIFTQPVGWTVNGWNSASCCSHTKLHPLYWHFYVLCSNYMYNCYYDTINLIRNTNQELEEK